jgi:DNA-binding CsgD family transcriptional regulator
VFESETKMDRSLDDESRARANADAEWVWRALTVEPGVGIALLRADGFVIYANRAMCEIWTPTGEETIEMTGRHIRDRFGPEMTADLLGVVGRVLEREVPIVRRAIFRGRQIESTHREMEAPPGELGRDLVVSRYTTDEVVAGDEHAGFTVEDSPYADFGPLDVLSRRELEILALLGQGLTVNEVAKMIFRSPKTVENHRLSIGRKLKLSNRVQLAKLAFRAGLRFDDAELKRV